MRKFIISTIGISVLVMAFSVQAETATIPEKVTADILKRHPKAHDLQANYEKHFGQELLQVSFKEETDELNIVLFTKKGRLFANEVVMNHLGQASSNVTETLKQHFPTYQLQKAELLTNPNGIGEEYEIYVTANGENWKITINDKGVVEAKEKY